MQTIPLGPVRAITFDMYGTLLDLVASFGAGFEEFLEGRAYSGGADDVIQAWEATYLHESNVDSLLGRPRTPIRDGAQSDPEPAFPQAQDTPHQGRHRATDHHQSHPNPVPRRKEHLTRIQSLGKYEMSVLSNGDLESLDRAVNGLSIPVDRAISAEGAGYYKPHTGVYQHAMKELGLLGEQVLHVAAHAWDIRGARAAGMAGAYINRYGIPYVDVDGSQPDLQVLGLAQLADQLSEI